MMGKFRFVMVAGLTMLASCASIVAPGPDMVPIDSTPPGATILLNGQPAGITPTVVPMRRRGVTLSLRLDGHHDREVLVPTKLNGAFLGNIIFPGLIGMIVDGFAGNASRFSEDPITVEMVSSDSPPPKPWGMKEGGVAPASSANGLKPRAMVSFPATSADG